MKFFHKTAVVLVIFGMLGSMLVLPVTTKASWPDMTVFGSTTIDEPLQEFVWKEIKQIIIDVLKKKAMDLFREKVMETIGEKGGLVGNWGEYLYGAGDSAAAKYWNSFLANCTNIDTSISLAIEYTAVDGNQQYDWCPVKVNARGVDLGEVNISEERGWEDFGDMIAYNNPYVDFFTAWDQVEDARAETEATQALAATSGGMKSTTTGDINDTSPESTADGGAQMPSQSQDMDIDTYAQQYLDTFSAATQGTFQVQANVKGILSAIISMALDTFIEETLGDDAFGEF